ncbi:MAG: hypothetical protein WC731_02565 [Candidatus Omnitrophota bacterium]|jgi:hypothetical protein
MEKTLIFVSCGQNTPDEIRIGQAIKNTIDNTAGFEGFFAEGEQNLTPANTHIFEALRCCSGAVLLFHDRGEIIDSSGKSRRHYSSLWVNQEFAILAYRKHFEGVDIPIITFADKSVNKMEGVAKGAIVNPQPLLDEIGLVQQVNNWLNSTHFLSVASDQKFRQKWDSLSVETKQMLGVLVEEGGLRVKEFTLKRSVKSKFSWDDNKVHQAVRTAIAQLGVVNLVERIHNLNSGDELSLHPTWEFHIKRALKDDKVL